MKSDITLGASTPAASGCACGCGGHGEQRADAGTAAPSAGAPLTIDLGVTGMTCAHCVSSVSEELGELDGVRSVDVDLVAGGVSTVRITADRPLDPEAVRGAVDEAGYQLA